jgi:hypothetical protein
VLHTIIEDDLPLLIVISPARGYDADSIGELNAECERIWKRGDRYAMISRTPKGGSATGPRGRKLIADWANRPRVRQMSKELCVGTATIVEGAIARGALTALLWVWTPAAPHHVASTIEDAVDWSLRAIERAGLTLPRPRAEVRQRAITTLRNA